VSLLYIFANLWDKCTFTGFTNRTAKMDVKNAIANIEKSPGSDDPRLFSWLGWRDSNPRMPGPKPGALPLGHTPLLGKFIC
jgi:hypothetical protein